VLPPRFSRSALASAALNASLSLSLSRCLSLSDQGRTKNHEPTSSTRLSLAAAPIHLITHSTASPPCPLHISTATNTTQQYRRARTGDAIHRAIALIAFKPPPVPRSYPSVLLAVQVVHRIGPFAAAFDPRRSRCIRPSILARSYEPPTTSTLTSAFHPHVR